MTLNQQYEVLEDLSRCQGVRRYPAYPEVYYCPLRVSCWRFNAPRDLMHHGMIHPRFQFGPPPKCEDYWPIEPSELPE